MLPLLESFRVVAAGLMLHDRRSLGAEHREAMLHASDVATDQLQFRLLNASRPGETLCKGFTRDMMRANGCNPDLPTFTLIAFRGPRPAGGITVYNLVSADLDADPIVAIASPMPFVEPAAPVIEVATTWDAVMDEIIDAPLALADGRSLDLHAWNLPTRPGHVWSVSVEEARLVDPAMRGAANDVVNAMQGRGRPVIRRGDGTPERIERG